MTGNFLYVAGDSFCAYRSDIQQHWPARLAHMLGLELQGQGYPGQGWWQTRLDLLDYINTVHFEQTQIFVFCHTDIYRPLTGNKIWDSGFTQDMWDFHIKYLLDYDFQEWASARWYQEISQHLHDKKIINLHCFETNKNIRNLIAGTHIEPELVKLSRFNNKDQIDKMNHSCNHFNPQGNQILAQYVFDAISGENVQIDREEFLEKTYQ